MGGHGGLNILPQKKWNVYNYENREKVRKDEEAAAKEEQLKREQSRLRDAEFRIERLRQARGLHIASSSSSSVSSSFPVPSSSSSSNDPATEQDSRHINLFDGLNGFSSLARIEESDPGGKKKVRDVVSKSIKKRRIEDAPVKPPPEDEKYKLGYGLIGKGVETPWYASKPSCLASDDFVDSAGGKRSLEAGSNGAEKKSGGRKTIEELREERMKREKHEKERKRSLLCSLGRKGEDRHFFSSLLRPAIFSRTSAITSNRRLCPICCNNANAFY